MREWFKYILRKEDHNEKNKLELSKELLTLNENDIKKNLEFNHYKNNELKRKKFFYLEKNLKKEKTLSIGSAWGFTEYFLSKKFEIHASDIVDKYIEFHKNNTNLQFFKLDILNENEVNNISTKYPQIIINNLEFFFNDSKINMLFQNVKKISTKEVNIFFIFRSRDSFIINLIDNYFLPFEKYLCLNYKKIFKNKKLYLTKNLQGFRRSDKDFKKLVESNNLKIESITCDMYEAEYNRLLSVKKTKISKLLSLFFFKKHPYLNIYHIKKNN